MTNTKLTDGISDPILTNRLNEVIIKHNLTMEAGYQIINGMFEVVSVAMDNCDPPSGNMLPVSITRFGSFKPRKTALTIYEHKKKNYKLKHIKNG